MHYKYKLVQILFKAIVNKRSY